MDDLYNRVSKLEQTVFKQFSQDDDGPVPETLQGTSQHLPFIRVSDHAKVASFNVDLSSRAAALPPLVQANNLFAHFAATMHPTIGILHIPSTARLIDDIYLNYHKGKLPEPASLMLLFAIFAASLLSSTPMLLQMVDATQPQATTAYQTYMRAALSILQDCRPLAESTTALAALTMLAHLTSNDDGYSVEDHLLRVRCHWMARSMGVHCIDSLRFREQRQLTRYNMIEVEIQRRVWWSIVSSDWLSSFSGGVQAGTYTFHPQHMNVDYPSNVDDEHITEMEVSNVQPLSEPTSATGIILRAKFATICREAADAMPELMVLGETPEYTTILALDSKFQAFLTELPIFYRLDPESTLRSQNICRQRPYIAWQRTHLHLALHTRLCRLHRPYHLKGMTDPAYGYSREVCVRSSQVVLDLRRSMDDTYAPMGLRPARFWVVVQHVSLAALTLATDVSFDAAAPDAEARKAKVLAAYDALEKSMEEAVGFREAIRKNLKNLLATLERQPGSTDNLSGESTEGFDNNILPNIGGCANDDSVEGITPATASEAPAQDWDWDQLFSEFLTVAPELDFSQWDQLLEGTNL
ncbi:hypothetical protein BJY04DRAFT_213971 [Aspergillus karnatakaensis]|uniref:fungal specific transcription factor domain-containing protein n=1 Tax=Aspergillus karnatakaensis TaxID=1810916 RepID=UPI003CCD86C8